MPFTEGHALIVGVSNHQYHDYIDVPIAARDAEAVAEILQDVNACGYPAAQVQLLSGDTATKQGILDALDDLADTATAKSTIFLFFCGHGAPGTDGNYYLVSHDVRLQGEKIEAGTGVSEVELLDKLRLIPAERLLVIINACYSGNLSPALSPQANSQALKVSNPPEESAMALLGTGSGRILITACRENQLSYIGGGTISIFTQALVDGLRGKGVQNNHGMISAFNLYVHLHEQVVEVAEAQARKLQEPELTVTKGVGPFAVALYKGATTLGNFAPERQLQGEAVREVSPEDSAKYFKQIINMGGGAYFAAPVDIGGDFVGGDKHVNVEVTHGDKIQGDKVQGDKIGGDKVGGNKITVGDIIGGKAIAIGDNATVSVNEFGNTNDAKIDPEELRAALKELWGALGAAQLPLQQQIVTQTAAGNAMSGVGDEEPLPTSVINKVKEIGETLKQTNTVIQEGSSLWNSVAKLAQLVGPVVGGATIVARWFGLSL